MALVLLSLLLVLGGTATAAEQPPIAPAVHGDVWINSQPLRPADLAGKVVLVEFWTFGCWNCRHVEPHVKDWHRQFTKDGLLILAVHSPEFPQEAQIENVRRYVRENGIQYAVAVDNNFVTWKRYRNNAWPALYLIGKDGRIRYSHVGEGGYAETEQAITTLLAETGAGRGT